MRANRGALGVAAAVATELLYGCSFVFTKDAVETISPAALLAWRFSVALGAMGVLLATRVVRLTLTRHSLRPLLLLALFQPLLYYAAETLGVQRTTASEGGILIATAPVGILLASWLVLGRPPSPRQVTGILITFAGVFATIAAGGVATGFNPYGYLLLLAAVASYSLYTVFAERDDSSSALDKTFAMLAVGAVVFTTIALVEATGDGRTVEVLAIPLTHPELLAGIGYLAGIVPGRVLPADGGDRQPGIEPLLDLHRAVHADRRAGRCPGTRRTSQPAPGDRGRGDHAGRLRRQRHLAVARHPARTS